MSSRFARAGAIPVILVWAFAAPAALAQDNVLLVIADDMGVDRVGAYGEHPAPGNTPTIDSLAADGVLFRNAWSNPLCSPTRATILTGRHGFRTGIGFAIRQPLDWPGLAGTEVGLPHLLGGGYHCEVAGKWHLGTAQQDGGHPLTFGFDHHRGSLFNITDYYDWPKYVDGELVGSTTYATTDTVDDALQLLQTMPEPWFLWVGFNAPHGPIHAPPPELHGFELEGPPAKSTVDHVKAVIEAMDTELGRLLASVDEDTTVIFVGDNGTYGGATDAPFDPEHGKGTLYEGGVNVPLIIRSPHVTTPGSECAALVQTTDLFATILELSRNDPNPPVFPARPLPRGAGPITRDSVSLLPYLANPALPSLRDHVYAERFMPNGPGPYTDHDRTIRDARYKLIRGLPPTRDEFYDLELDPFEQQNLLPALTPEQQAAFDELGAAMAALLAS